MLITFKEEREKELDGGGKSFKRVLALRLGAKGVLVAERLINTPSLLLLEKFP